MTAVILAAGTARRMGSQKLLLPIGERTMIGCVIAAAAKYPIVIVAGPAVAKALWGEAIDIVVNDHPALGMTHSLRLADAAVARDEPIAVLLGDMPGVTSAMIDAVTAAFEPGIDIVSPYAAGRPAHPVILGPNARLRLASLPAGDTLRSLRDMPGLRCVRLDLPPHVTAMDIDTPEDYQRFLA